MAAQGVLAFPYRFETGAAGMTAPAGLPVYPDLSAARGLGESIGRHVRIRPIQAPPP